MIDETKLNFLIDDWLAARKNAVNLLVDHLHLESPRDILNLQYRGRHLIADTGWVFRTHGTGVDVTRINGRGGIDFDFAVEGGKLFSDPDWWRLQVFAKRAVHDREIDTDRYAEILPLLDAQRDFVQAVIIRRFDD